jgi:hypothetical protein
MDKKDFTFDEETHVYRYKGNIVTGVTSVLQNVGLSDFSMVPEDVLIAAMEFGTEVHKACELFDNGDNPPETITADTSLYLCHYIQFINDYKVDFIEVEKKVFCEKYYYAGTLDRVCVLNKVSSSPAIMDIKTGGKSKAHQIQTAAYEYAEKSDKRSKMDRYTLYLSQKGYELDGPHTGRQDFDVFLAALTVTNYKLRNK